MLLLVVAVATAVVTAVVLTAVVLTAVVLTAVVLTAGVTAVVVTAEVQESETEGSTDSSTGDGAARHGYPNSWPPPLSLLLPLFTWSSSLSPQKAAWYKAFSKYSSGSDGVGGTGSGTSCKECCCGGVSTLVHCGDCGGGGGGGGSIWLPVLPSIVLQLPVVQRVIAWCQSRTNESDLRTVDIWKKTW